MRAGTRRPFPVDEQEMQPIYYRVPKTFADAVNDGERWRWLLARSVELAPGRASEVDWHLANFFPLSVRRANHGAGTSQAPMLDGEKPAFVDLHT